MPKLIFRSNYFKNEPAVHRSNYIKYLGTREGVEMNPDTLPSFFYEDQDMHGKKENYIDYISERPGVALNEGEQHGLSDFSEAIRETVNGAEGRIVVMIYKLAVELAMLNRIIAYDRSFAESAIEHIREIAEKEVKIIYKMVLIYWLLIDILFFF